MAEHDTEGASRRGARPPSLRLSKCTDGADRSVGRDPRTSWRVGEAKHAEKKKERRTRCEGEETGRIKTTKHTCFDVDVRNLLERFIEGKEAAFDRA